VNTFADPRAAAEAFTGKQEHGWWPGGPGDPNPTENGVTQGHYSIWRAKAGLADQSVQLLSPAEQAAIYDEYWASGQCPAVVARDPTGVVSIAHFDAYFNGGGAVLLQETVGVTQDGIVGPGTLDALTRVLTAEGGAAAVAAAYLQNRLNRFRRLHNPRWEPVWEKRLNAQAAFLGLTWTVS
jgi:lysozyme family protein